MEEKMTEIKKIINDWYSFKLKLSTADIMPYLVLLYEEYELIVQKLKKQQD